ncbi:MAG: hypothetical protein M0R46_09870 [Candidatus Muirbacterium halophilum]|nr:hypothetical protein [Candidatus Muirbacterium halophilum]
MKIGKKNIAIGFLIFIAGLGVSKASLFDDVLGFLGNYLTIGGVAPSQYQEQLQTLALNQLGSQYAPALDFCYVQTPTSNTGSLTEVSLNACQALGKMDIPDPCSKLPDLSAFGFSKRTNVIDVKKYCANTFGDYKKLDIGATTNNFDSNSHLKMQETYNNEKQYNYEEANKNTVFGTAVSENDYATVEVYKNILNSSTSQDPKAIRNDKINVAYSTVDDYEKSLNERVDMLSELRVAISSDRLKKHAIKEFTKVNQTYPYLSGSDQETTKREDRKKAVSDSLNNEYGKMVDRYVDFQIKQKLLLEYEPAVVNPTKEYVDKFRDGDRAKVVFAIEKQKAWKAQIIDKYKQEGERLKEQAQLIISKARTSTNEVNEKKVIADLDKLIK